MKKSYFRNVVNESYIQPKNLNIDAGDMKTILHLIEIVDSLDEDRSLTDEGWLDNKIWFKMNELKNKIQTFLK